VLEHLDLHGPYWNVTETFNDGEALYEGVCDLGLEGVVAKEMTSRYGPTKRGWVKVKNPSYWPWDAELEAMRRSRTASCPTLLSPPPQAPRLAAFGMFAAKGTGM
jgi:hypothetical protein